MAAECCSPVTAMKGVRRALSETLSIVCLTCSRCMVDNVVRNTESELKVSEEKDLLLLADGRTYVNFK